MTVWKKIDTVIEKAVTYFCTALCAAIVVVVFTSVVFRYVLNSPLSWGEEVTRFCSIWMILVGSSMTVRADEHTSIDFIQTYVKSPKAKTFFYVLTRVLAAVSMIVMFPCSCEMMVKMGIVRAAATGIPMWVVYLAFPVGIVCMVIAYIVSIPKFSKQVYAEAVAEQAEREAEKKAIEGGEEA